MIFSALMADGVKCTAWCEGDSSTRTLPRCRSRTSWSWWVPRHPFSRECAKEERKNAFPSFTREQALFIHGKSHPIVQLAPHPHQKTSIFSNVANVVDPVRPETWVFHYCLSIWTADDAPETAEERRALFKHYMSQYCEPYRSAGEWLSQATPIRAEKVRLDDFIGGR